MSRLFSRQGIKRIHISPKPLDRAGIGGWSSSILIETAVHAIAGDIIMKSEVIEFIKPPFYDQSVTSVQAGMHVFLFPLACLTGR